MVQNLDPVAGAECFMRYAEDSWRWRTASAVSASDATDATVGVADPVNGSGPDPMEISLRAVLEEKTALLKEVRRLTELYATLSHINQAIVRNSARQDLLDEICQVTAHFAGFQLAWIGWLDPQTQHVRPVARAGVAADYLNEIVVYADGRLEGCGPVGVCLREGRASVLNDFLDDPRAAPWRAAARRHKLRAAAAMPIRFQGEVCAAFVVYAATPGVFQAQEISLLEEAAADISFALDHLETERQRQDAEERIAHLAHHDALTQLPNRALLTDLLHQAMVQSRCDRSRLAVCYLDLDDFKSLNDALGHAQGDRILVEVARRLRRCMRASDTVARLGGDEFVLLLGNLADVEECEQALGRVRAVLEAPFYVAGQPLVLTASLGVTLYPDDDAEPDVLLRHTHQAMYAAKQAGGRCYHWFDADHERRARVHRKLLDRVEAGLAAGEFRLHYQPKVDMRGGAVIGVEALIRWQNPEQGLIPPARFMPAVESSALAIMIGR